MGSNRGRRKFSRMDRIYTGAHVSAFSGFVYAAFVLGPLASRDTSSDHRAVSLGVPRCSGGVWHEQLHSSQPPCPDGRSLATL